MCGPVDIFFTIESLQDVSDLAVLSFIVNVIVVCSCFVFIMNQMMVFMKQQQH